MIQLDNVTFIYEDHDLGGKGIYNIALDIKKGECVVLCGKSGCGKTTILRLINGLIPHFYQGECTGKVTIKGKDIIEQPLAKTAELVGSVFQNPRTQFFNVDTTSELAFGCENQGIPVEDILNRIDEARETFTLDHLMDRSIFQLSGGEKQRIACASVYTTYPDIYVLDEPSSSLDASSIRQLSKIIKTLKNLGKTIIISEHRLHYLKGVADKFVYINQGEIQKTYSKSDFYELNSEEMSKLGLRTMNLQSLEIPIAPKQMPKQSIDITNLTCKRGKKMILDIDSLALGKGEIVALIGGNGAGKTTLAHCLCGLLKHKGTIVQEGENLKKSKRIEKSYMVMQDVNSQLFTESVYEEVSLNVTDIGDREIDDVLISLGLYDEKEAHPMSLSGGQKQRVAIASAMLAGKEILIFDEPTSGLDYENMMRICALVKSMREKIFCALIITHDLELILGSCDRVIQLDAGKIQENYSLDEMGVKRVKSYFTKLMEVGEEVI